MATNNSSLPYHEPFIETVVIITGFLLLLNICNYALDRLVYCGLLGQILIGVWFGTPGTRWLSNEIEHAAQIIGYLGLILLVYEGGLSTSTKPLKANLMLSTVVAMTGICSPIALSFVLPSLLNISSLQAFAAGAALCSTSLGTTFTVLSSSGLTDSRLGVVLTSAAMMDDVVGLVMVKLISILGTSRDALNPVAVVRPVLVSIAFAVLLPVVCGRIVAPTVRLFARQSHSANCVRLLRYLACDQSCFVMQSLFLLAIVSGATYAGTSGLFAAYLAGVCITWFDDLIKTLVLSPDIISSQRMSGRQASLNEEDDPPAHATEPVTSESNSQPGDATPPREQEGPLHRSTGLEIYKQYYKPSVDVVFKPFFFASIGFSIPITQMFTGSVVWRGLVYAVLMAFGKLLCGIWLIRIPGAAFVSRRLARITFHNLVPRCCCARREPGEQTKPTKTTPSGPTGRQVAISSAVIDPLSSTSPEAKESKSTKTGKKSKSPRSSPSVPPLSLYPAAILGGAMVARGEIGFLISSVAESSDIFTNELFLVVTWAIFLCTLAGPLLVGLLVRRVKSLQTKERSENTGKTDPLGDWGVLGDRNCAVES